MKKLLLFATIALFSVFTASSQCTWTINSFDSFGDGWNGNAIDIQLNGTSVLGSPYTLLGGASGTFNFTVNTGDVIDIIWDNTGSWDGEVGFDLLDAEGNIVHSQPTGSLGTTANGTVLYTGTTNCASCLPPSNLSATNITDVSADLNWDAVGNALIYNVEWGFPGFTPGVNPLYSAAGITGLSFTATFLTQLTSYEFYVMADCGPTDGTSAWAGPFAFTTICSIPVSPWTDDVEAHASSTNFTSSMCWSASATSGYDWNITGSGTTPSFGTGAANANSGTKYFYTEASGAAVGAEAFLTSPDIDVSALTLPMIEFYYHMTGSQMGDLNIEVWDGTQWNVLDVISGEQQTAQTDAWIRKVVYVPGLTSSILSFRFRAVSNGSFEGDICIDDISVLEAPSCPEPIALTVDSLATYEAFVSWTSQGSETEWEIEYGTPGFTPGTGTSFFTGDNPDTISGLMALTSYEFYVRAVCGPGDTSLYTGPVSFTTLPTCPEPNNFMLTDADLTSASFSWNPVGTETNWIIEYGPTGFTQGTGSLWPTSLNPDTITGLTQNQFYDAYLVSVCGPGDTSFVVGPVAFNTYNQGLYMDYDYQCPTGGFIDISSTGTVVPNMGDDTESGMTLPFPVLYQGVLMTDVTIGSNAGIFLGSQTQNIGFGGNFNTLTDGYIWPWGDDMHVGSGAVYQEVQGTSPNQIWIVQWDGIRNFGGADADDATFQIQIHEATGEIFFVYDDVVFGGGNVNDDYGANADIGVSGPNQDITVSTNDTQFLMNNTCARFYYTNCPAPTNFAAVPTTNTANITWSAGLAGETDWTIIYGPQGFDPTTAGTTITSTSPAVIIPSLTQLTTYDVYIYADCNPGSLQSIGYMGSFTTLPNCSDVTNITTATAVDSLMTSWMWVESSGVGTYPSTGFNLQYGLNGFGLYDGTETIVNADNNFTDTTTDNTLIGGGVYQVYVQAVCGTDTSNWTGPVTFIMPLSNDSTCDAIALNVDGTVYTFNNTGATTQVNETTIVPPVTGAGQTDGWSDGSIELTTWFTFTAPASGNVRFTGEDEGYIGQMAVYEATDCSDFTTFTLIGANDYGSPIWNQDPVDFILCGLTAGNTYYLMHDNRNFGQSGNYSIRMEEIIAEAGTSTGLITVCTGDTVNVQSGITGFDPGYVWTELVPTANFTDSTFPTAGLAYQVFDFQYTVTKGCAVDSVIQQVQIYGPSSAGTDGTISACQNEPINLLSGLGGNVDLGGQWYDPSNNTTPASITTSSIPGSFNYEYITSNGICPSDTANVVLTVNTCDWLNIEELVFGEVTVFPNPTTGLVYISNNSDTEVFSYELTDINGRVIATSKSTINGSETAEVNLNALEDGIYMIRLFNENAEKTYRVIKN